MEKSKTQRIIKKFSVKTINKIYIEILAFKCVHLRYVYVFTNFV